MKDLKYYKMSLEGLTRQIKKTTKTFYFYFIIFLLLWAFVLVPRDPLVAFTALVKLAVVLTAIVLATQKIIFEMKRGAK